MKKLLALFTLPLLFLIGCDTDLDINADYEEVMVVYGLLDYTEPVQYIRVQKAYLDASTSALELAKNPDSIYYRTEDLIVQMEIAGTGDFVNLTPDTVAKDDGIFSSEGNILYRYDQTLDPTKTYNLRIENTATGKVVTSSTPVLQDFSLQRPTNDPNDVFDITFVATDFNTGIPRPVEVQFFSPVGGKVYNGVFRFHYIEFRPGEPADTTFIDWPIFSDVTSNTTDGGEVISQRFTGQDFYTYLAGKLEADIDIVRRPLDVPGEYVITAGGEVLWDLIRVNTQGQAGITGVEAQPDYTNIEGGLGIFSTRSIKYRPNLNFMDRSLDSLACGQSTAALNFEVKVNTSCD